MQLYRLKLDHDGVYFGAELVDADVRQPGDVLLDHAPDNAPGRYKWNAAEKRLDALPASQVKSAPDAPTLEQALYDFIKEGRTPRVVAWCDWFEKTLDEKGKK